MKTKLSKMFSVVAALLCLLTFVQSVPVQAAANDVTVYYKRGFATPYIHYKQSNGAWTSVPGVAMAQSEVTGYSKVTIDIGNLSNLEACFNDGKGNWDSNYGRNYFFNRGVYTYDAGKITAGAPKDTQAPTTPGANYALAWDTTYTSTVITWGKSYDNVGVTGYEIYRDGALVGTSDGINLYNGLPYYTDYSLQPNRNYTYTVKAFDAAGNKSSASVNILVTTLKDTQAPTTPGNLQASLKADNSVYLTWENSSDNVKVDYYEIYRVEYAGSLIYVGKVSANSTGMTKWYWYNSDFTVTGPNATATYIVKAVDSSGNKSYQSNSAHPIYK